MSTRHYVVDINCCAVVSIVKIHMDDSDKGDNGKNTAAHMTAASLFASNLRWWIVECGMQRRTRDGYWWVVDCGPVVAVLSAFGHQASSVACTPLAPRPASLGP